VVGKHGGDRGGAGLVVLSRWHIDRVVKEEGVLDRVGVLGVTAEGVEVAETLGDVIERVVVPRRVSVEGLDHMEGKVCPGIARGRGEAGE
jgi:hypothetical protein